MTQRLRLHAARPSHADLDAVTALIEAGAVTPAIEATYELADTAEAICHLTEQHARAKIVIAVRGRHAASQPATKETKMHDLRTRDTDITEGQAGSILRWGGLAGICGSVLMLFTFGVVAAFVGMDITPEQALRRYPEIRAARTVENSLWLVILLLWVVHALGLHRALRRASPTPALVGTVLSIVGFAVLAAGALPHLATAPLSDLYHASEATAQDQATLLLVWHGIDAMFDALLFTGLVILPLGLIGLGVAMLGAPGYGTRIAATTVGLGVVGLAAATAVLVGVPVMGFVGVLALIGFHLTAGWQTRRQGRTPHPRVVAGA